MLDQILSLTLLVLGFGFVIFWHELGHFLAAKWVGIRVEQFAVGFGQAMFSWRQGMGLTVGSSGKKYEELAEAGKAQGIGETEYRLNWIPLGGYVKMLGQDDLNPNAQQEDPRAYNKKSIGARMLVVSAGVLMNIFLAAAGFMIVFLMGFNTQPPVVGAIQPGSPAQLTTTLDGKPAPLQVGDRVQMLDGQWQHSFDKIQLNVALAADGWLPMYVKRATGQGERVLIRPSTSDKELSDFLMIGVAPMPQLKGVDPSKVEEDEILKTPDPTKYVPADSMAVRPGDVITEINGQKVNDPEHDYPMLDKALQESDGKPIALTVRNARGESRQETIRADFMPPFSGTLNFAGMMPRAQIESVRLTSSAKDKLFPGDVIAKMTFQGSGDSIDDPTELQVRQRLEQAGKGGQLIDFVVLRGGERVEVKGLAANVKIPNTRIKGLNVALRSDQDHAVVAATAEKSPAAAAGIPAGATLTAINGQPVANWFDVKRLLGSAKAGEDVKLSANTANGPRDFTLKLDAEQVASVAGLRYMHPIEALAPVIEPRKTGSPVTAAAWGVTETRDFILQFYLTLHRMFTGRVSYKNMMGPVGIFNAGRHFADKGPDWLIWFLAMISANLAVVNFLPIPIVDGGLFTFLIVEKIQGRPLSAKTQSIAQFVGLAIILSVFLLVTYQDIARIAF